MPPTWNRCGTVGNDPPRGRGTAAFTQFPGPFRGGDRLTQIKLTTKVTGPCLSVA